MALPSINNSATKAANNVKAQSSTNGPTPGSGNKTPGGTTGFNWSNVAGLFGQAATIGTSLFGKTYDDNSGFEDEQAATQIASNFGP